MKTFFTAAAFCAAAASASASTLSGSELFEGTFVFDNDLETIGFELTSDAFFSATSYGYSGGTSLMGDTITGGGFDTLFTLFDSDGRTLVRDDDGGIGFDSMISMFLGAGTYSLVISQFSNDVIGSNLANGYEQDGLAGLSFTTVHGCSQGEFCDVGADNRTGNWAVELSADLLLPAVPVPASLPLMLAGLAGFGVMRRKKK